LCEHKSRRKLKSSLHLHQGWIYMDIAWQRMPSDKVIGAGRAKQEARQKLDPARKLVEGCIAGRG
jgi:hypothetical protein